MAPKRQSSSSDASASKKPRKSITMEVKYDVIKRSEKGESNTEIGRALGLSRTMVVTIVKDKQRILKQVQEAAPMKATVINVKQRSQNVVEMEKLLLIWLEDQNQRFKARANLHNVKLQGEAASAYGVAAESFPSGLAEIIREGGYTADQGLPFKVLLVLDNAPGHLADLSNMQPNVKVVYLPPNTTSLIQPMDQGVIANFKAYYLRRTIRSALRAVEGNKELTLKEFWKGYNIADTVTNIARAWDEIKVTTLNGAWKKLCPQFVNSFEGFEQVDDVETVTRKIAGLSKRLKLDFEAEDVTELLASHGEELSLEDLTELEKQMIEEEEEAPQPKVRALTVKGLREGFAHLEKCLAAFEGEDPNIARFERIGRGMLDLTMFYKETLKEKQLKKKVQSRLDSFFVKKSPAPPATPSLEVTPNPDSLEPLPNYESEPEPEPVPVVPSPAAFPAPSDLFSSDDSPDFPEEFQGFEATGPVSSPTSPDPHVIASSQPNSADLIPSPAPSDSQAPADATP
ncbi:tigger transposable element-derived protein 1-like [Macrobrachium rosenbergii]|uniref:tigger transposable element-derived protein 1-like n=1 Tax=Macrobrachium rosenbergii TaxID=79674 RepID=UPI0034D4D73D